MIFEQLDIGGDRNYAYLIGDPETRHAAVVDPGTNADLIIETAAAKKLEIMIVINTHSHADHTGANFEIKQRTGAKVLGFNKKISDIKINDGDIIELGELELKVMHTPGHTPDSICILVGNNLCTGDTLFVGKVGGTQDFKDGKQEYDSIHEKILALPDTVVVYPGHNYGVEPTSTIEHERKTNPFLLRNSFEEFMDLKLNWVEYKRRYGIK